MSNIREFNYDEKKLSKTVKYNAAGSLAIKGLSFAVNLVLVPITLNFLGNEIYGIWLTMYASIAWITMFDMGFGNGLRNKLAESLTNKNIKDSKYFISSSYIITGLFSITFILIFYIGNHFLDWAYILNTQALSASYLSKTVLFFIVMFTINITLGLINSILLADQKAALSSIFVVISNLITLGLVYYLSINSIGGLFELMIVSIVPQTLILIIANFYFFSSKYKLIRPSYLYFSKDKLKILWSVGFSFFVLQIAYLVLFTTDNLIITRLFSPAEVTPYNIIHRYFQILSIVFGLILAPLWSAFTVAFINNNFSWIYRVIKKALLVLSMLIFAGIIMFVFSDRLIQLWVGDSVYIEPILAVMMLMFTFVYMFNNIFLYFINGVGKIKFQVIYSIFAAIINIPLSIFLAKNAGMGVSGVITATLIIQAGAAIWLPYQFNLIMKGKHKGIWVK